MKTGPNREQRPGDPIACAVTVGRIATGDERPVAPRPPKKRKSRLTPEQRSELARKAARARWDVA